jgi:hypothetical protein
MKRFSLVLMAGIIFLLSSCETTREITFTDSDKGTMVTTTDMSGLIGLAKMSGQGKDLNDLNDKKIDTTMSMAAIADSIEGLSAEDKALVKKGTLSFKMNLADEKFLFKVELPFNNADQIGKLDQLSSKMMQNAVKKIMAKNEGSDSSMMSGNDLPSGSIDEYFTTTYAKGLIEKKLNKEKYANVGSDDALKGLKEMSGAGIGNSTLIINLPRAAKKAEGKNLKLSDDKKKVTITSSMEDFFDDATELEFRIEY